MNVPEVKYEIFQPTLGSNRTLAPYATLDICGGETHFDFDFYNRVYVGVVNNIKEDFYLMDMLDDLYVKFNMEIFNTYGYPDFKGHSMSTGDIVKVDDCYYYCDIKGWREITQFIRK